MIKGPYSAYETTGDWIIKIGRIANRAMRYVKGEAYQHKADAERRASYYNARYALEAIRLELDGLNLDEAMEIGRIAYDIATVHVQAKVEALDPDYRDYDPKAWLA